jgi:hypothetical protein
MDLTLIFFRENVPPLGVKQLPAKDRYRPSPCENSVPLGDRRIIFHKNPRLRTVMLFNCVFRLLFRRIFYVAAAVSRFYTAKTRSGRSGGACHGASLSH